MIPFPLNVEPPKPPRELCAQDRATELASYFARQRLAEHFGR